MSWYYGHFTADDWLVTPQIKSGAEVLKFMVKNVRPERYDVYVVPAPASGTHPTKDEILATGIKVYENDLNPASADFSEVSVDISDNTSSAFHIAFHHRTLQEDGGIALILDNIMVGYNDSPYNVAEEGKGVDLQFNKLLEHADNIDDALVAFDINQYVSPKRDIKINFGILDAPDLVGYKIEKDGAQVGNIDEVDNTAYAETLEEAGVYTYKVYAVYSDGESEPVSVTVDASSLATTDIDAQGGLKVYPNPSNGMFVVEQGAHVNSFNAEVFNLAGQLIYREAFTGNKASLNLTQLPAGVYVLSLNDDKGVQKSVKIIIQ